jgi:hypothetical protein
VVEVEERNEYWRMKLGSDYEELIALINCIGSVDVTQGVILDGIEGRQP